MKEINKEFDAMEFLEKLYEIDKQIIEEYERLKDEVKEGVSLEKLNLLKLKLLIIKERTLLKQAINKNIDELWFMVHYDEIPENLQETFKFEREEGFKFNLESPIDERVKSRMENLLGDFKDLLTGHYVTDGNEIQIPEKCTILIIPVIESFLLAKEQIFSLKQKFNLDNQIVRQLYIYNNFNFLNKLSWNTGFDLIMILNKPNINIDDEFIESIKLLSKDLYREKKGLKDESSAYGSMLTITSLSEIILDFDDKDVKSLFKYIALWAQLEIDLKSCELKYIDYFIKYVEEMEYFADERIRDSILELLKTKKNKLK